MGLTTHVTLLPDSTSPIVVDSVGSSTDGLLNTINEPRLVVVLAMAIRQNYRSEEETRDEVGTEEH